MARILVIDDDPSLRRTLRRMLERAGHQVVEAEDGARGLDLVRAAAPDLVVTDLLMPEQDGIETINMLTAEFPGIPIVAVSGAAEASGGGILMDAHLFGASATLAKPFSFEELVTTVERVLGERD